MTTGAGRPAASRLLTALAAALLLSAPIATAASPSTTTGSVAAAVSYRPPVVGDLVVVRRFDDVGRYDPGHRGVDLQVAAPGAVLAAGAGVVTFAGSVAGRGVVTVLHADGIRTSYEPVTPSVSAGADLAAGDPLGVVTGGHGSFAAGSVLHWGARRGEAYLDPLSLLEPLGPVRLRPWDP